MAPPPLSEGGDGDPLSDRAAAQPEGYGEHERDPRSDGRTESRFARSEQLSRETRTEETTATAAAVSSSVAEPTMEEEEDDYGDDEDNNAVGADVAVGAADGEDNASFPGHAEEGEAAAASPPPTGGFPEAVRPPPPRRPPPSAQNYGRRGANGAAASKKHAPSVEPSPPIPEPSYKQPDVATPLVKLGGEDMKEPGGYGTRSAAENEVTHTPLERGTEKMVVSKAKYSLIEPSPERSLPLVFDLLLCGCNCCSGCREPCCHCCCPKLCSRRVCGIAWLGLTFLTFLAFGMLGSIITEGASFQEGAGRAPLAPPLHPTKLTAVGREYRSLHIGWSEPHSESTEDKTPEGYTVYVSGPHRDLKEGRAPAEVVFETRVEAERNADGGDRSWMVNLTDLEPGTGYCIQVL